MNSNVPLVYACLQPMQETLASITIVSRERLEQIEATKSLKAKAKRLAVWSLMERLALRMLAENGLLRNTERVYSSRELNAMSEESILAMIRKENWSFTRLSSGKWLCDRFFFSLSHTDGFVAASVSTESVGIDIENKLLYKKRFAGKEEGLLKRIRVSDEETGDPLVLWTQKEAITKCEGKDRFIPKLLAVKEYPVQTKESDEWICSVCSDSIDRIRWVENET